VGFTIEVDDLVESLGSHRTATGPAADGAGPWLISLAMWQNFLRLVEPSGTPLGDLAGAAAITNVAGLKRWGWIRVDGEDVVHLRKAVVSVRQLVPAAVAEVEQRWESRYGAADLADLRTALDAIRSGIGTALPRYLPVVRHTLFAKMPLAGVPDSDPVRDSLSNPAPDLPTALAQVLIAFTLDAEDGAGVALPVSSNVLAVLGAEPVLERDLPQLTGLAKEGAAFAVKALVRSDRAELVPAPGGRGKALLLTEKGARTRRDVDRRVAAVEQRWSEQLGPSVQALRSGLEAIVGEGVAGSSPLLDALVHPIGGWRAARRSRQRLPRYPMVLHRGGYPDGA
jgi:hypothetical protein